MPDLVSITFLANPKVSPCAGDSIRTACSVLSPLLGEESDDANAIVPRRFARPVPSSGVAAQCAETATFRELCGINGAPGRYRSGSSIRTDRDALSGTLRALESGGLVCRRGNGLPVTSWLSVSPHEKLREMPPTAKI